MMSRAHSVVGHDRGLVLERVADVAVLVAIRANRSVVELVLVGEILVPLVAVILPGNVVIDQHIGDVPLARRGNREWSVVDVVVGVGVRAVAEIARVVVIQQVVMARIAVGLDRRIQRRAGNSGSGSTPGCDGSEQLL